MENASRALLIAGSILIAIIIISLLVKTYGNIGMFKRQQLTQKEVEQINEFNKQYTKYANKYVYGTEVITVINRATSKGEVSVYVDRIVINNVNELGDFEKIKGSYYFCNFNEEGIYDSNGKIQKMYFEKKNIENE